jgi:phage host-nuclease inhibitor protein Gam
VIEHQQSMFTDDLSADQRLLANNTPPPSETDLHTMIRDLSDLQRSRLRCQSAAEGISGRWGEMTERQRHRVARLIEEVTAITEVVS